MRVYILHVLCVYYRQIVKYINNTVCSIRIYVLYVHEVSLSAVVSEVLELGPGGVEPQGQLIALRHDCAYDAT